MLPACNCFGSRLGAGQDVEAFGKWVGERWLVWAVDEMEPPDEDDPEDIPAGWNTRDDYDDEDAGRGGDDDWFEGIGARVKTRRRAASTKRTRRNASIG